MTIRKPTTRKVVRKRQPKKIDNIEKNNNLPKIHKFSVTELFNDSKGRTSPSKILGFFGGLVSIITFMFCGISIITKYQEGPNVQTMAIQSVAFFALSATLLGIRRFTKDKEINPEQM